VFDVLIIFFLDVIGIDLFETFDEVQLRTLFVSGGIQPTAFVDTELVVPETAEVRGRLGECQCG